MRFFTYQQIEIVYATVLIVFVLSCANNEQKNNILPSGGPYSTILVAQAQFVYENKDGKKLPKPGPALLVLKQKTADGWRNTVLEDPQSNVFHKALILSDGASRRILTIGAMEASLKLWEFKDRSWRQSLLWQPEFGGKWNRLRDVEIDDVTGDGKPEFVIATHDQGVVAVVRQAGRNWQVDEIDREPQTFIHEVETGDVDADGLKEIFVTPSRPNKAKGGPQPGKVVMYKWNGSGFLKKVIDESDKTHAKEILVCDIDGKGVATLFAVFEAETIEGHRGVIRKEPVKIKKYSYTDGQFTDEIIATLEDFQCRFLTQGDVDGDGRVELVAAAMKTGVWLLKQHGPSWTRSLIDADSSGYEHATCVADLDENGIAEIYVASDDQQEFRQYVWNGKNFSKTVLSPIPDNRITWNITTGLF